MPVIGTVSASAGRQHVIVTWLSGAGAGRSEIIDLSPLIDKFKLFAPIRENDAAFKTLELVDDGRTIEWLGGDVHMAVSSIERLAQGIQCAND